MVKVTVTPLVWAFARDSFSSSGDWAALKKIGIDVKIRTVEVGSITQQKTLVYTVYHGGDACGEITTLL